MKLPKVSKKSNMHIIALIVLLIIVIFITSMPFVSNSFHEALENISNVSQDTKDAVKANIKDKVASQVKTTESTPPPDTTSTSPPTDTTSIPPPPTDTTSTEGFSGDMMYSATTSSFPSLLVDTNSWNTSSNNSDNLSVPLNRNDMYMFSNSKFSSSCCARGPGSGMSTSMGCLCLNNNDAYYITEGRGGNNMNPCEII
jgi:hypothetical protein